MDTTGTAAPPTSRGAWSELADLARGIVYYGILALGFGTPLFALVYGAFIR